MAVDAGMAEATVRGLLEGPAAPTARALVLKTERALKHKYKITGVPHFIFDNKVAFSGAQDPSTFLEVFGDLADE
jgi:predicted DsbA family dithiol-disulfide isomerase